jgi:acetyltransferase-like isoleucine patch superfamily enzyme
MPRPSFGENAYRLARWFFSWRLRAAGIVCAGPVKFVGKPPRFRNAGEMRIGRDLRVHCRVVSPQFATGPSGRLVIGDHVGINEGVAIGAEREITIGDHVTIGDFASINDSDYHELEPARSLPRTSHRTRSWAGIRRASSAN